MEARSNEPTYGRGFRAGFRLGSFGGFILGLAAGILLTLVGLAAMGLLPEVAGV